MWMAGSHFREGRRWLTAALAAAPAPTALRAEALRALCGVEVRLGWTEDLPPMGNERVEIFRRLGDRVAVAHALDEVGVYEYMAGRHERADRLYAESMALADELGNGKVAAAVLHSIAILAHCRGDYDGAREALLESLRHLREIPATDSEPFFRVHTIGLFVSGSPPRITFEETLQFFRRVDARRAVGYVLAALGDGARAQGLNEPARERLAESLAHFREARDPMGTAFVLNRMGNLARVQGDFELGREWLEEALAIRRELGDRRGIGVTLGNLGALAARAGDLDRARALVGEALVLFEDTDDAPGAMGMRLALANIESDAGETRRARGLYELLRTMAEEQRLFRCAGWVGLRLAELALADGADERAERLLASALDQLRPLGDAVGIAWALELDQTAAKRALSPARQG
jgi:tetratricopeptide (TPR) repeat protein